MPAPSYGWPIQVRDLVEQTAPGQWMFTGSFAMFCYATVQSQPCRDPADIDILVKTARLQSQVIAALSQAFGGTAHGDHADGCHLGASRVKIDVGVESATHGQIDADCLPIVVDGNNFPLISVTKLQASKRSGSEEEGRHNMILSRTVMQDHGLQPRSKHTNDLTLLDTLVTGATPNGCVLF
jgi:hypothetical protein